MKRIFESSKIYTKSDVLKFLKKNLKYSKIEKLIDFTVHEWEEKDSEIIQLIQNTFSSGKIIIRSSALDEDSLSSSQAGKYTSILYVNPKSKSSIRKSISKVIESYKKNENSNSENKILVQQQSENILISGVLFTRSNSNGSPYYTINYDEGKSTDSVTSGRMTKTIKIFRKTKNHYLSNIWKSLIKSVQEIEQIFDSNLLDIEFGLTKKNVVIFQVRPITTIPKQNFLELDKKIHNEILKNKIKFDKLTSYNSKFGKTIAFSDMSDWNPSEIIGNNPNLLDYSLYDELIMKSIWTKGRSIIGYNDVNNYPLMVKFGNKPYVDLRASFNSLIPKTISKKIQKKLLKYYFKKIQKSPYLHDKIEFDIVFTCYDYILENKKNDLLSSGFTKNDIEQLNNKLLLFTKNLIKDFSIHHKKLHNTIIFLSEVRNETEIKIKNNSNDFDTLISVISSLLENCKRYGTLPFSTMARYAFVGNIILKSLVISNKITQANFEIFMDSIKTPLTDYKDDLNSLYKNKITKKSFLKKYGHLRPGTYDITIPRYDSHPELFSHFTLKNNKSKQKQNFNNSKLTEMKNLDINFLDFLNFVSTAITIREQTKFEFTKTLSDLIEYIAKAGSLLNFSRQDMANLSIIDILKAKTMSKDQTKKFWKKQILKETEHRKITDFLILPPLVFDKKDFEIIDYYISQPNFITSKKLSGTLVKLDILKKIPNLENKIVLIENADPGYDWIFTKNPKALITKYGGLASHMAIRCSEVRLPAAIGCGELLFSKLMNSERVLLDCNNKQLTILENKIHNSEDEAKKILKLLGYIK